MSNFIFSRRSLQQSIGRLAGVIEREQLAKMVGRLNKRDDGRLPAMWELVILDALSTVGTLHYEVRLPDGRCPDVQLTVEPQEGEAFHVVADVTAVSDTGIDEQNPIRVVMEEFARVARKAKLNPNNFSISVQGRQVGPYGDARRTLLLPPIPELQSFLLTELLPWINRIKSTREKDCFEYVTSEVAFSVAYDPEQRFATASYLSYQVAASRDKNPLFSALKLKVKQLKEAPTQAVRVIIACDGDCALLRQSASPGTFSAREVAADFLRQNKSTVDAIALIGIVEQRHPPLMITKHKVGLQFVRAPEKRAEIAKERRIAIFEALLQEALGRLPEPMQSAGNANEQLRRPGYGLGMLGGYKMGGSRVSISSRTLQRLLAGEMTLAEFLEAHNWGKPSANPFARMAKSGRMITDIVVESAGDKDDDWLTFSFGPPDPAAALFQMPPADS